MIKRVLILCIFLLSACAPILDSPQGAQIVIQDAWIQAAGSAESGVAGAFMTIQNDGQDADTLLRVTSPASEIAEIHQTKIENQIMQMSQIDGITIQAGEQVYLAPGGYHVMLINLKQLLNLGDKITLTLFFEQVGEVAVEAEVRKP